MIEIYAWDRTAHPLTAEELIAEVNSIPNRVPFTEKDFTTDDGGAFMSIKGPRCRCVHGGRFIMLSREDSKVYLHGREAKKRYMRCIICGQMTTI